MKSTNDLIHELMERDDQASDLEDMVAAIKSIIESPYTSDEYKINLIKKEIQDYGY